MRRWIWVVLVVFLAGSVWGIGGGLSREDLSLKAGPTEPGESLALVWVEALVYPRVVKSGDKAISLGVRSASPVKAVKAAFDFTAEKVDLGSSDGMSWSGVYRIPAGIPTGVHVVRYQIIGSGGSIQRTLEFYVEAPVEMAGAASQTSRGETFSFSGWPLTVTSTCAALSGNSSRILYVGQKLVGLSKVPWYKVLFEDGSEGWVPITSVQEPTENYYLLGHNAYKTKNFAAAVSHYRNAVAVDPDFVKGYLWLAKSYMALGNLDSAGEATLKAMRLDERDIDVRVIATDLAQKYFSLAHSQYKAGRYHEAVETYRRALDLKPASVLSWVEMGESLQRLGLEAEAHSAWKEALKYDPENQELRALLKTEPVAETGPAAQMKSAVAPTIADDSLQIVKAEKTKKGTKIEAAIRSVVALTKSLGTPVMEKGWQIRKQGEKFLVSYLCQQGGGALESFDWLVDVDARQVLPHNDNARLLMSRW